MAFARASNAGILAAAVSIVCGCAPPPMDTISQALAACSRGASHDEFRDRGSVVRILGTRHYHEGFIIAIPVRSAQTFRVEDNLDITGPVPLSRGETIELQGQLECNDFVIHWTHHDPAGRHIGGYIDAGGARYQ